MGKSIRGRSGTARKGDNWMSRIKEELRGLEMWAISSNGRNNDKKSWIRINKRLVSMERQSMELAMRGVKERETLTKVV
jgi:hypothetical protein